MSGGEHTAQYTDAVLRSCTPETYVTTQLSLRTFHHVLMFAALYKQLGETIYM